MSLSKFFPCLQFQLEDNISKLDYSHNILSEQFPHVWQYERTLEELNVTSTRINYLPPQLFYCQGLKFLLANNNNLESIPEAIGLLRQLQLLNLSRNFISNVPDNIKSCKNLTHLDLSCNSLQKLPDAITSLISLQELILNETYLEFLPANFGRLVNLRIVELRSNNLISLPKSMQRLINLQRLDIGCNEFTTMPEVVGELKQLRELWFDFNQIQTLPLQIGKLCELIHCEASGNCLRYLPSDIGNWHNVEVFSLAMNNLSTFPFSIGMFKSLVTLKCESNELAELPACISKLKNLEELVVSNNKLVCLPNTIGMLRKLRFLFADGNNLQQLPDDICSCSSLSVISVSRNSLTSLPENIGHLKNLKVLNIVQNNIATLPVSLLNLVNLTSLWISNNQSQPLIPLQYAEISQKTHLTCFMLPQFSTGRKAELIQNYGGRETQKITKVEHFSDKATESNISKRRICFAAETMILDNDSQMPRSENCNYFVLNTGSRTDFYPDNEIQTETVDVVPVTNSKDYLMRSPTPYPKELRMMAKCIQGNHQNNSKNGNNIPNSLLENKCCSFENKSDSANNETTSHALCKSKSCEKHIVYSSSRVNNANIHNSKEGQQIIAKAESALPTNSQELLDTEKVSPKPPPYFIARCFTKKSVQDLTSYEFARKNQQHRQFQDGHNYIDNTTVWPKIDTNLENDILLSKNVSSEYTNINSEYQNKIINEKFEMESKYEHNNTERAKSHLQTTSENNKCLNFVDSSEASNNLEKIKCTRSRTKWLFGVHKNPRVIQVIVNWESVRGFEIDVLPNKEGIFVSSTVPNSNLIHPMDKLLEVEGIDFTNIGIKQARQVLEKPRPSISIMLSRK